ncbi:MAG: hypothetical protein ACOC6S_03735 [Chloroflexota bacterium]
MASETLKPEAWSHNTGGIDFPCVLCGEWHEQHHAAVCFKVRDDDPLYDKDICPYCVEAGPAGAAKRALQHADQLRDYAKFLDDLAARVEDIDPSDWASLEDLREAETRGSP